MKKNLGLILLLASLLGIAYYSEEVSKVKVKIELGNADKVLKTNSKLIGLHLPKVTAVSIKEHVWRVSQLDYPGSKEAIDSIILILKGLSHNSIITAVDDSEYFQTNKISFSLNTDKKTYTIILGDVSPVTGNFYFKVNGVLYSGQDQSHFSDTYTNDLDLKLKRYLRLKKLLDLKPEDLIEKSLFRYFNLQFTKFAKIDNKRNRWFQLDFVSRGTVPAPYKKVKTKELKKYFSFYLKQVSIKKIITGNKNVFTNLVSEVDFGGPKSNTSMKLFAGLNGEYGKFLRISGDDRIYEIEDRGSEIFYGNVQDYWWKKFPINVDFKNIESFQYEISLDHEKYKKFSITDIQKFKINTISKDVLSVNQNMMNFVFNLLLNLVDFKESTFISSINPKDEIKIAKESISVKLFGSLYNIHIRTGEIQVLDMTNGLKHIFKYNTGQFKADTLQRIFTVKKK
jgi:hypothetical protein